MRIGVILDSRAPASELAELGRLAEAQGLSAVWTSSLIDARDPFTNLAPLATTTHSIRLGPIAVNPFDTHPVRIATSLLTLNELASGRAQIVIGGGGEALEALGIAPARRVRAVRECLEIVKGAGAEKPSSYEGEIYRVEAYHPYWATAPKPHVFAAANGPQMLRMAGRVADGIMVSDLPVALLRDAVRTTREAVPKEKQRTFGVDNFIAWHVYDDVDTARKEARQWLALRGLFRRHVITTFLSDADYDLIDAKKASFFNALARRTHEIDGVPERILDALVDNMTLCSPIEEIDDVIAHLREFAAAGLTDIALRLYRNPAESIRLIGERLVPALA